MAVVALDTNALMMPVELDVRVFRELSRLVPEADLVVPRAVLSELERLAASGGGTEATAARVGLDLARERCRVVEAADDSDGEGPADRSEGPDCAEAPDNQEVSDSPEDPTDPAYADDALYALARRGAVDYVVTNDRSLADRLLGAGVRVIGLRGANQLEVRQP